MIPMHMVKPLLAITSLPTVGAQLMPLVILALLIDVVVLIVWYYLGVVLNNSTVKASALSEFYQFIGTVIMVGVIVGTLVFLSSVFYSTMGLTTLMSPSTISTLCTNIQSSSSLDLIGKTNSLLSGPSSGTGNFVGLCSLVTSGSGSGGSGTDITSQLDYPLAASTVVIANLTNQTAANYNNTFTVDAYLGFLTNLRPTISICLDPGDEGLACLIPNPIVTPTFRMNVSFAPYAGYDIITNGLSTLGGLLNLSVESFVVQLLVISIFLYAWPYLLFVGFILRGTFLTRRLGGLLIAVAVCGLIVYPAVFSFEYLSLGHGLNPGTGAGGGSTSFNGFNSTYGYNAITTINSISGNYIINFFVEPNVKQIAVRNNCWPSVTISGQNPLFVSEAADMGYLLLPGTSIFSLLQYLITSGLSSSNPSFYLPSTCQPQDALNTFFQLLDSYGLIGITSYLIPLLNAIITLSAIVGMSQLFGGDTQLAGLARLL